MLKAAPFCLYLLTSVCTFTSTFGDLVVFDGFEFSDNTLAVDLGSSTYPITILEYSDGLSDWVPVSRNYGNGWENVFPRTHSVNNNVQGDAKLIIPKSNQGFFRTRYESSQPNFSAYELVSLFLMQATFGPSLDSIEAFNNVTDLNFHDNQYANYEFWINEQINKTPFFHRAYWRERSDPSFTGNSSQTDYLENEVGHNSDLGQRLPFYRGQVKYATDNTNPLPGFGGLFCAAEEFTDSNNNGKWDEGEPYIDSHPNGSYDDGKDSPIDASLYSNNLDWRGIPKIGLHIENSLAHKGNKNDTIGLNANDTEKVVWFEAVINSEDELRQRVAWALSQYFVVGESGSNHPNTTERYLNFYDIFVRNAFGNFRDILSEITWSPHMGYYLSYIENKKADVTNGTFPDENFAREVMQLFTIGLWELNEDGTLEFDNQGNAIPTYNNDDIAEFAKVFTGLRRPFDRHNIEIFYGNYIDPMRIQANRHDFSSKKLLDDTYLNFYPNNGLYDDWESFVDSNNNGIYDSDEVFTDTTESEAVRLDVEGLLDHLFNHKNMAPFFAKFLIQRMTVSNPSPNYIKAVANAFKTGLYNGLGTSNRGDMVSTIKAVLLHPEARERTLASDPSHGKLREPIIRLMHLSRAFKLNSLRTYDWIYFEGLEDSILQAPYEYPSVFNFYRPDYSPNGEINNLELYAPEFQINNDVSALNLANAFNTLIYHGIVGGTTGNIGSKNYVGAVLNFDSEIAKSNNVQNLINHLNLILCAGRLGPVTRQHIASTVIDSNLNQQERVKYAISLVVSTIEFNTLF